MFDYKKLLIILCVFLIFYFVPFENAKVKNAIMESFLMAQEYAKEHILTCLVPAFFIAGAIGVFLSQASVMKYLGPAANKALAYGVASVSGTILAVCSCTVLPLFAGIYKMGAGLGPAAAFLYSGPAINILAIAMTARILGLKIGIARAVGAILFSLVIGISMQIIFKNEEEERLNAGMFHQDIEVKRALWKNTIFFISMIGILIFANWAKPDLNSGLWNLIYSIKWKATGFFTFLLFVILYLWFEVKVWKIVLSLIMILISGLFYSNYPVIPFVSGIIVLSLVIGTEPGENKDWFNSTYDYLFQILPLLLGGVFIAGFLLGRPGHEGIIPSVWIAKSVGGNSIWANLFASVAGAFMYFATLTEVPILQGLLKSGMGQGPALALLLAGPALSLPNMIVIQSIMGTKKTVVFVLLVIIMATISGFLFGAFF